MELGTELVHLTMANDAIRWTLLAAIAYTKSGHCPLPASRVAT